MNENATRLVKQRIDQAVHEVNNGIRMLAKAGHRTRIELHVHTHCGLPSGESFESVTVRYPKASQREVTDVKTDDTASNRDSATHARRATQRE